MQHHAARTAHTYCHRWNSTSQFLLCISNNILYISRSQMFDTKCFYIKGMHWFIGVIFSIRQYSCGWLVECSLTPEADNNLSSSLILHCLHLLSYTWLQLRKLLMIIRFFDFGNMSGLRISITLRLPTNIPARVVKSGQKLAVIPKQ